MKKSRRKIYLIDPKFQIKFGSYIAGVVLVTGLLYPLIIYDLIDMLSDIKNVETIENSKTSLNGQLILALVLIHAVFSLLVFMISIFFSHKIAGPIYKIKKYLKETRQGRPPNEVTLRKSDYFLDLADEINLSTKNLMEEYYKEYKILDELLLDVEKLSSFLPESEEQIYSGICLKINTLKRRYETI